MKRAGWRITAAAVLAAAVVTAATLSTLHAGEFSPRAYDEVECSILRHPLRIAGVTHLTGLTLPDTIATGDGGVRADSIALRGDVIPNRPVHGQVVRVYEVMGRDSLLLEKAFRTLGAREVILVPWALSPGCRTERWRGSFAWLPSGEPTFIRVTLRSREQWVDGRPVADIFAALYGEPYPHGSIHLNREAGEWLTPAQYIAFYRALPTESELRGSPSAAARVREWVEGHPKLAGRHPARDMLDRLRHGKHFAW